MNLMSIFAFLSGVAIATQTSLNAQLGSLLKNPLLATCVAFTSSIFFTLLAVVAYTKEYPSTEVLRSVPVYLWFSGGILSAFGISMFYYLIPKMGVGPMMSFALTGQLIVAIVVGHFGWFDLPVKPITLARFAGVVALILGVILINKN
jgi:transporter family-2 protein